MHAVSGFMQTYCAAGQTKCVGVKAQLLLSNGHRLVWTNTTSNAWLGTSSPWAPDDKAYPRRTLWDGAVYNASLDLDGWSASDFDASGWASAELITPPVDSDPVLTPHDMPPMVKTPREGIKPVSSWISPKGTLVADFGNNMAGYVTIQLPARAGGGAYTIMAKHAEMLTGPKGSTQNQCVTPVICGVTHLFIFGVTHLFICGVMPLMAQK